MKRADIFEFFRRLAEADPSPQTELEYANTYQLLVAVVLSAQATDVGVNKATRALFREVATPQQMLELGEDGLRRHIRTIGLFNAKAKNVIALSEILVRDHGGVVPAERDALTTLPGVGRKTANVVMNCAFGAETFAVDTHVFRVCNRTALAKGKTPAAVEAQLDKQVPQPFRTGAHHWLILHGRYTCKARAPECWRCPVIDLCAYQPKLLERGAKPGVEFGEDDRPDAPLKEAAMNYRLPLIVALAPLAFAASVAAGTSDRPSRAPVARVVGDPASCIPLHQIRETKIRDDYTIDFLRDGRRGWRNTLTSRCSGLRAANAVTYETSLSELCDLELVYVLQTAGGLHRGPGCGLGKFVPIELER